MRDVDFRVARAGEAAEAVVAPELRARIGELRERFGEHMDDDVNTAAAVGELFALAGDVYRYLTSVDDGMAPLDAVALRTARAEVTELAGALLLRLPEPEETGQVEEDPEACASGELALPSAAKLAEGARWEDVEYLYRDRLDCGDPTYAVALRDHYRAEREWAMSDRLRDELQAAGFEVRDTRQGTQVVPRT